MDIDLVKQTVFIFWIQNIMNMMLQKKKQTKL